jgi:hypothetical protein
MYITHNNHLKFGWGNGTYNLDNKFGEFWVRYGRAEYQPASFREECVRAARLIGESAKKPILIFFSGGIDSEIMVRSFQEADVPFEVAIMKFKYRHDEHINAHETKRAFEIAIEDDLTCHTMTLDLEDYFKNVLPESCRQYKTNNWSKLIVTEMIKHYSNYHCVIGGGNISLQRHKTNGRSGLTGLYLEEELVNVAAIEAAYQAGTTVCNRFFMYTPELMLAWLTDPQVSHWVKYENALTSKYTNLNYYGIKTYMMYKHWPDMHIRPKYSGIERMTVLLNRDLNINEDISLFLKNINLYKRSEFIIDYATLIEWLTPEVKETQ